MPQTTSHAAFRRRPSGRPAPLAALPALALAVFAALSASLLAAILAPAAAQASPYAYYAERQRGETLVIKHSPAPGIVVRNVRVKGERLRRPRVVRHRVLRHRVARRPVLRPARVANVRDPAIAGFCRDGGAWRRAGSRLIVQKEICESVAYYSEAPNDFVIRPDKTSLLPF